jgi:hypothetical protein
VRVGLQPAVAPLLVLAQPPLPVMGPVGLLGGYRQPTWRLGLLVAAAAQPAKHAARLATGAGLVGRQGLLGLLAVGGGPGEFPAAVAGGLVELAAQPVPLGPQLGRGQPPQIRVVWSVHGQGLAARPGQGLGQLQVPVGLLVVRQVQLPAALGLGADHGVQAGVLAGPGQLHIQPVHVLAAGEPDQSPAAGQPLGAMPGGGIGQIHPPVALPAGASLQVGPGQGHRPAVGAVEADGQGSFLGIKGRDGAAAAVGHP